MDDGFTLHLIHDTLNGACVITDGARVRHAHDRGEPACRRRFGATTDVFFVRLTRVTEVDVDID